MPDAEIWLVLFGKFVVNLFCIPNESTIHDVRYTHYVILDKQFPLCFIINCFLEWQKIMLCVTHIVNNPLYSNITQQVTQFKINEKWDTNKISTLIMLNNYIECFILC